MLIFSFFQVHQSSCTSGQWTWYIAGVKKLINCTTLRSACAGSELDILADWAYYHDVLARFTLRHWNAEATRSPVPIPEEEKDWWAEVSVRGLSISDSILRDKTCTLQTPSSSELAMIRLLEEVCDAVAGRPWEKMSVEEGEEYRDYLKVLDWRIRRFDSKARICEGRLDELFQLATLVCKSHFKYHHKPVTPY
jgi:hypothetical protein